MKRVYVDVNEMIADARKDEQARCVGVLRNIARLERDRAGAASVRAWATVEGLKDQGLWDDVLPFAVAQALEDAADTIEGQ